MEFGSRPAASHNQWLTWSILTAAWVLCILVLIIVTRNTGLPTPCKDLANNELDFKPAKNELKDLSYTYNENNRPVYSVRCSNLRTENNNFGIFKTGLHKIIKIQNLQLAFHPYATAQLASTPTRNNSESRDALSRSAEGIDLANVCEKCPASDKRTVNVSTIVETLRRLLQTKKGWHLDIDFSNTSEILVNGFEYKIFSDENHSSSVQSKRLMMSSDQSAVTLRGHVTIKAADGSTLESNYVQWDIANQSFTAQGGYVLNRNGTQKIGKKICVDNQLNGINVQQAKFEQKEETKCLAKL